MGDSSLVFVMIVVSTEQTAQQLRRNQPSDYPTPGHHQSCRDGFLWRTRSYLRAWDRGIAVIVRASSAAASSPLPGGSSSSSSLEAAEPSGRLCEGVELLETALGVAEGCLPPVSQSV